MDNKPALINPLEDNKFIKVKFVDHDAPDQYKRNEFAWMKEEVSRELYRILEQCTYPCVVYIDEHIIENAEGSLETWKMMDKLLIEVFLYPVERKWRYSVDRFSDLHYNKVEKESKWKEIWKLLRH